MTDLKNTLLRLWQDLPIPRRISLAVSVILSLSVLGAIIYFSSRPKLTLLYGGLDPTEAARIVEHLESKKISYELSQGGRAVLAPASDIYKLRLELASQGIPRLSDTAGGVGFELFDKPAFGMSDFIQRANYLRALQGELARTIRQMDEISDARVIMVSPEERLFGRERGESKASVFIRVKTGRALGAQQVDAIRHLVANAVEGLQPNRVAVVDSSGRALAADQQANTTGAQAQGQLGAINNIEQHLQEKAQSMLDQVLGPGQSVVRVAVDLDFDAVQETAEHFDPKGAVVRTETTSSESSSSSTETGNSTATASSSQSTETTNKEDQNKPTSATQQKRENATNQYEINKTVETRQKAVGRIRRISAAVFVNLRKNAVGGATPTPTPRTPQEVKAIDDIVREAIGFTQDVGRQDSIKIQEVEFSDWGSSPEAESKPTPIMTGVNNWLPYTTQGFLALLAVSVLFYLRSIIAKSANAAGESDSAFDNLLRQHDLQRARNGHSAAANGNGAASLSIEELGKLIRENPGNTTRALKEWVGRN